MSTATTALKIRKKNRITTSTPPPPTAGGQAPGTFREDTRSPWQLASLDFTEEVARIYAGKISPSESMFHPLEPINVLGEECVHQIGSPRAKEFFRLANELIGRAECVPNPKTPSEVEIVKYQKDHLLDLSQTAMKLFWAQVEAEIGTKLDTRTLGLRADWHVTVARERGDDNPLRMFFGGDQPYSLLKFLQQSVARQRQRQRGGNNGE